MHLFALPEFPLVAPGDDLASLILDALARCGQGIAPGDVVAVAQKIVSKAENRYVRLADVAPGPEALALAAETRKDPRLVELVLRESSEVVRKRPGVLIMRHRLGYVMAQAGIDQSNLPSDEGDPRVLLLPEDPNASAARLRRAIEDRTGVAPFVIVTDSWGRPWRRGVVGFAIGTAGFAPLVSRIGETDLFGRRLEITEVAVADQLAAAASFLMGEGSEGSPVVMIRGARLAPSDENAEQLLRPREQDLFR